MPFPFADVREKSFIASYRPPRPAFTAPVAPPLAAVWAALRDGDARTALDAGLALLREDGLRADGLTAEVRAALTAATACACSRQGHHDRARQMARAALDAFPAQWLARRVLIDALPTGKGLAEQGYQEALALVAGFPAGATPAAWDEALPAHERHLTAAACAWLAAAWSDVARHLTAAFPGGVGTMPAAIQEDWFRLAFYREAPDDAAEAATLLIATRTTDVADVLLQTLVKQGWHRQALALYRTLYDRDTGSELLRRRLVGLCIREGDVVGARKLMERGALKLSTT